MTDIHKFVTDMYAPKANTNRVVEIATREADLVMRRKSGWSVIASFFFGG